jgi:hypothetical protein
VRDLSRLERTNGIQAFKLSYRLLARFSQTLDTAKRAICALNSAVCSGTEFGLLLKDNSDGTALLAPDNVNERGPASNNLDPPMENPMQRDQDPLASPHMFSLLDENAPGEGFRYDEYLQAQPELDYEFWGLFPSNLGGMAN